MARNITFSINEGTWNIGYGSENIRQKASDNISKILTAIDNAASKETKIDYKNISIQDYAKEGLDHIWEKVSRFNIDNANIEGSCLKSGSIFQIRDIHVTIANSDYKKEKQRSIVIAFNKEGTIENITLQPLDFDISYFKREGAGVVETDQRLQILHYVERFRLYYETKNLEALREIFSEDALIITGARTTSIKSTSKDGKSLTFKPGVKYNIKKKEEYMQSLETLFKNTESIEVKFSNIELKRHRTRGKYYYVSLRQLWQSNFNNGKKYMDDGNLFLLWDFSDPDKPMINIRKWSELDDQTTFDDINIE